MNLLKGMIGDLNVYGCMSLELGSNTRIMKSTLHTADKIHVAGKGKIDILELREKEASLEAVQGIIGKIVGGNQEETTTGSRDQQDNNPSDPPDSNEPDPDTHTITISGILVNEEENQVEIRGMISSTEGNWSMLDQTTINGNDGEYTFIYRLTREIFRTYAVYVGGEGIKVPAQGSFTVYPRTDATVSQITYRINDQVYEIFIAEGVEV